MSDPKQSKSASSSKGPSKTSKGSSSSSSKQGKADHVIVRNLFALSILRRQVLITTFAFVAAVLSVFSAYQVMQVKTPPQYIQLTEDGRIFPIAPLSANSASDAEILSFAGESVKWLNTYDYKNWKDQLQGQAHRFSPQGWESFIKALVDTDNLKTVEQEGLVVSADVNGQPIIEKQGVIKENQTFTWLVKVPVKVSYSSLSMEKSASNNNSIPAQEGTVSLYISRVPLETNLRGYAIQIYQFEIKK